MQMERLLLFYTCTVIEFLDRVLRKIALVLVVSTLNMYMSFFVSATFISYMRSCDKIVFSYLYETTLPGLIKVSYKNSIYS